MTKWTTRASGASTLRLLVCPKGCPKDMGHLSIFLDWPEAAFAPANLNPTAKFKLTVINQKTPGTGDYFKEWRSHLKWSSQRIDWGFTQFMPLAELLDPDRGFVVDDTLKIRVEIQVQKPAEEEPAQDDASHGLASTAQAAQEVPNGNSAAAVFSVKPAQEVRSRHPAREIPSATPAVGPKAHSEKGKPACQVKGGALDALRFIQMVRVHISHCRARHTARKRGQPLPAPHRIPFTFKVLDVVPQCGSAELYCFYGMCFAGNELKDLLQDFCVLEAFLIDTVIGQPLIDLLCFVVAALRTRGFVELWHTLSPAARRRRSARRPPGAPRIAQQSLIAVPVARQVCSVLVLLATSLVKVGVAKVAAFCVTHASTRWAKGLVPVQLVPCTFFCTLLYGWPRGVIGEARLVLWNWSTSNLSSSRASSCSTWLAEHGRAAAAGVWAALGKCSISRLLTQQQTQPSQQQQMQQLAQRGAEQRYLQQDQQQQHTPGQTSRQGRSRGRGRNSTNTSSGRQQAGQANSASRRVAAFAAALAAVPGLVVGLVHKLSALSTTLAVSGVAAAARDEQPPPRTHRKGADGTPATNSAGIAAQQGQQPCEKDEDDCQVCVICQELPRTHACAHGSSAHFCLCEECVQAYDFAKYGCPLCRQKVLGVFKLYG